MHPEYRVYARESVGSILLLNYQPAPWQDENLPWLAVKLIRTVAFYQVNRLIGDALLPVWIGGSQGQNQADSIG